MPRDGHARRHAAPVIEPVDPRPHWHLHCVMRTIPLIMMIFWFFFLMPIITGRSVTPLLVP